MGGEVIDLGHGHTLRFTSWSPDRELNPQYAGIPDIPKIGAIVDSGNGCQCAVYFDLPGVCEVLGPGLSVWQVESWDPLTLSPSLLCRLCNDHGFIKQGRWIPA